MKCEASESELACLDKPGGERRDELVDDPEAWRTSGGGDRFWDAREFADARRRRDGARSEAVEGDRRGTDGFGGGGRGIETEWDWGRVRAGGGTVMAVMVESILGSGGPRIESN